MQLTKLSSTAIAALLTTTICAIPYGALAREQKEKPAGIHQETAMPGMERSTHARPATVQVQISTTQGELIAGKEIPALLTLTDAQGQPVTFDNLQTAHTKKIHLLIIDESLTDYHHEHPVPTGKPGEYSFTFRPKNGGSYVVFADLLPTATGKQEYAKTQVEVQGDKKSLDEAAGTTAIVDGYRFDLSAEGGNSLRLGESKLVKVKVTKPDGQPADILEPVMGAFAHGVGFPSDRSSVVHVHPMGVEPEKESERGGPDLSFHIIPDKEGYMKFYVQVQIDGRDRFAGFGFNVEKEEPTTAPAMTTTTAQLSDEQNKFLNQYESIHTALAADDFTAAKKAAQEMTTLNKGQKMAAGNIAGSESIKSAREAFKTLSAEAVKIVSNESGYFVMACPMVENGKWIQTTKKVSNPYLGGAMPSCGSVVK